MQVFLSLLEVWGDASSVKHTAYEQHRYISQAVLICVGHLNSQEKEAYKDGKFIMSDHVLHQTKILCGFRCIYNDFLNAIRLIVRQAIHKMRRIEKRPL